MKKLQTVFKGTLVGLLLIALSPYSIEASHYSAGELFYQWIGNEPSKGNNCYRVFATIYRNTGGANIGTGNLNGCAYRTSGGSPQQTFTLSYLSPNLSLNPKYRMNATNPFGWKNGGAHPNDGNGWNIPAFDICATSSKSISEYRYVGEVCLPTTAADWHFAVDPPCCRDGNDNLASSGNLYLEVDLNNTLGHNSSPRIITPASKAFCVVQPNQKAFDWAQTAREIDGDSIVYGFDPDGSLSGNCGNGTKIGYSAPYTASDPFPSVPKVSINQNLGVFTMSPSAAGSYVVKFKIDEFRFDTASLQWLNIGNTVREVQIQIAGQCKTSTQNGPQLDPGSNNVTVNSRSSAYRDSLMRAYNVANLLGGDSNATGTSINLAVYTGYTCWEDVVTIDFDVPIKCETVVPTDFRLIGPDGNARPIVDVLTNCQVDFVTTTLDLKLFRPLDKNGTYLLQVRRGNDGNTLENECGFEIREFYSALIPVDDCPGPEYSIKNVTVNKDQNPEIFWEVNDSNSTYFTSDTNTPKFFNYWSILRRDHERKGSPMVEAGRLDSFAGRSFVDSFKETWPVDLVIYDYQVVLVTNNNPKEPTDTCNTIRLQDSLASDESQLQLYWNKYNCWDSTEITEYTVYDAKIDTSSTTGPNWQPVADVGTDTSFLYQKPPQDSLNQGLYSVKIESQSPFDSSLISESNWIYYKLTWKPDSVIIPPVIPELGTALIPNIITPNGDGINDRFYVSFLPEGSRSFERISVKIYNRWGQLVFEDANFHERNTFDKGWDGSDMNSGNQLGNGVYYYLINLDDPSSGESDSREGHITITGANASR